jgi:hypothetical protein
VLIGGRPATAVTWAASTRVTAVTPVGSPGAADVVVVNADGGAAKLANGYTYEAVPTITAVTPDELPVVGDTTVVITGTGFAADATVLFGSVEAYDVIVIDGSTISVVSPVNHPGPTSITVTNPDVGAATLPNAVDYVLVPQVLAAPVSPVRSVAADRWVTVVPTLETTIGTPVRARVTCRPVRDCTVRTTREGVQIRATSPGRALTIVVRLAAPAQVPYGYEAFTSRVVMSPRVVGGSR